MPEPAEAEQVLAYFVRNRDHLEPWEPERPPGFYTRRFWAERLERNRVEMQADQSVRLFLRRRDTVRHEVIGSCSINNILRGAFQSGRLGYGIDARCEGLGMMSEALRRVIAYAFDELGLHRLRASYQPMNERSGRLLTRLGFEIEGYARNYLFIAGAWRDHVLAALRNPGSSSELARR